MELTARTSPIRIVIADDHIIFRQSLTHLLKREENIYVIGQASNGKDLLDIVSEQVPDIVITDICMPEMDGLEATREILKRFPDMRIIALSSFSEKKVVMSMVEAGVHGYLLKTTDTTELLSAIKTVYSKGKYYCKFTMDLVVDSTRQSNKKEGIASANVNFSEKELTIIKLICKELSNKEIAAEMGLSTRSVESSRERLQSKTGRKNMVGIAIFAIKNGFFALSEF